MPMQHDTNTPHPRRALLISADVLEALLPAAASFYKVAMQARAEHKPYALDEHTLIALHIAIDTAARELGVEEQPFFKDIVRS